ncbi:NTP transferase domain-containing protein [Longimicrobium terrae]|uniref:Choline kinase n=1 Tax=Longimicrobium terrae TaxID=1639882 RepID=A0A841H0C8_9BACT|nr:phosphocholine cytidylyltransferase family protein [Longimicrobium terrae]MBB4636966.1 choline kinase [Longimicrobium terrae]MBB6071426.1 choline kinase [Longimicrobium terrae]NNC31353.1 phosphocholine cytidylyltransferase family protein [Longimicrobium terrae]
MDDATGGAGTWAVILAAGLGSRLGAEGRGVPKCLTPVAGTPILLRALAALEREGAGEVVIVVGCMAGVVRAAVGPRFGTLPVRYVENARFADTGTSESLRLGLQGVDPGAAVVVLEGDVVFEDAVLHRLLAAPHPNATVVEPWEPRLTGTFVDVDAQGMVRDWVHERDRPAGTPLQGKFKTVNLTRFGVADARAALASALQRAADQDGGHTPLESVMRRLVRDEGVEISAVPTGGLRWFEVDTPDDLAVAEAIFSPDAA